MNVEQVRHHVDTEMDAGDYHEAIDLLHDALDEIEVLRDQVERLREIVRARAAEGA